MKDKKPDIRINAAPPPVLGLHLASLLRSGFVRCDYLHLTALRIVGTAAVSLADTYIPSLGPKQNS